MSQFTENLEALIDFFARQRLQAFGSKTLYGKRSHDAPVKQGPLQHLAIEFFLRRDVPHETTRKRVARSRRILYLLDRQRRRAKGVMSNTERSLAEENRCPILPMLDDQRLRSHRQHLLGRSRQVRFARNHLRLGVIDQRSE